MKMKLEVKAHHPLDISCRLPEHLQRRALILIRRQEQRKQERGEKESKTEREEESSQGFAWRRGDKKKRINFRHPSHSSFVKAQWVIFQCARRKSTHPRTRAKLLHFTMDAWSMQREDSRVYKQMKQPERARARSLNKIKWNYFSLLLSTRSQW